MKVSLNWLKQYLDLPPETTTEEIASRLTFSGLEIEGVEKKSKGLEKVFVGKILERKQHPNADRLSVCQISVGTSLQGVSVTPAIEPMPRPDLPSDPAKPGLFP